MSEHVLVAHVAFLKHLLGHRDGVGMLLEHLFVLKFTGENQLSTLVNLNCQALLICFLLHQSLIRLQSQLHFYLAELNTELFCLSSLEKLGLNLKLFLLLQDLRLLQQEHLPGLFVLLVNLCDENPLFLVNFADFFRNLEAVLVLELLDLALHLHHEQGRLLAHRLAVVRLQVLEKRV